MKLNVLKLVLVIGTVFSVGPSWSTEVRFKELVERESLTIKSVKLRSRTLGLTPGEWKETVLPSVLPGISKPTTLGLNPADLTLDQIMSVGKEAWTVVDAGRPVANIKTDVFHALPQGAQDWTQFSKWSAPESKEFEIAYENPFGVEVVRFSWRVQYTAGGSLEGIGRYLANISIIPAEVYVAWGFTLDADAGMNSITNAGTSTDPMAATEVFLHLKATSVVSHWEQTTSYYIRGDGQFKEMQE